MGITMILSLLSGVALFLFGMSLMGDGLKRVAGNKLELILYQLTNTPVKGILLGAVVTAIIQSSSATTVMVVGFVNSGMMKVAQAIGIIMGANIGTSITGWILCLSYIDGSSGIAQLLSTATISAIVAIIGIIFKMFLKKAVYKNVGDIMLGFSILMVGMQTMSGCSFTIKGKRRICSCTHDVFESARRYYRRYFVYSCFAECICVGRYFAGIISYRSDQLCNSASDHNGNWCRGSLSGIVIIDRNK